MSLFRLLDTNRRPYAISERQLIIRKEKTPENVQIRRDRILVDLFVISSFYISDKRFIGYGRT